MTDSSYVGDSPGKKLSRMRMWCNASQLMSILGIPFKGAYVLAGEGGDVSVLRGMGMDPRKITAVDLDPDYAEFCGDLHGCKHITGEAGEMSRRASYNAAHMDFCNGLTAENAKTVADVVRNSASYPMMVGVTMMKGREHKKRPTNVIVDLPRSDRRRLLRENRKAKVELGNQLIRGGTFDPGLEIQHARERLKTQFSELSKGGLTTPKGKLNPLGTGMVRIDALRHTVNSLLIPDGISLLAVSCYTYHSKSKQTGGTPFVTGMLIAAPDHYIRQLQGYLAATVAEHRMLVFHHLSASESWASLKPTILNLAQGVSVQTLALLFDMQASTIIAWKAHATRGTYEADKGRPVVRLRAPEEEMWAPTCGWGRVPLAHPSDLTREGHGRA